MDETQLAAMRTLLTKEVALIDGPPATGKTHLALLAIRALLTNRATATPPSSSSSSSAATTAAKPSGANAKSSAANAGANAGGGRANTGGGPLLVLAATDRALDQLLEGVLAFEPRVVRVGGRVTRERLKPTALRQVTNRLCACIYTYIHIYTHIYTYLSISVYLSHSSARRRPGDPRAAQDHRPAPGNQSSICMYIYTHIYTCLYLSINISVYQSVYLSLSSPG